VYVNDGSAATRRFLAYPKEGVRRVGRGFALALVPTAVVGVVLWLHPTVPYALLGMVVLTLLFVGWAGLAGFRGVGWLQASRRKVLICVTRDGLTVDQWPDDVFSYGKLGLWEYNGTREGRALYLDGPHQFVLGSRDRHDHPGYAGMPLAEYRELRRTRYVDGWLWDTDFDRLLHMVGHPGP
jgi:hypothetical protein